MFVLAHMICEHNYVSAAAMTSNGSNLSDADNGLIPREVLDCYRQEIPPEDKPLNNWSRWLKIRQRQQETLCGAVARAPQCLAMNQEDVYELKREKWLVEQAEKLEIPDKYRGHTKFWKTPVYLKPGPNKLKTMVHSALENFDRNVPPVIQTKDQWGVPWTAEREKQVSGPKCVTTGIQLWNQSESVARRKRELEANIDTIGGFKADLKNLSVEGKSPEIRKPEPKKSSICLPSIVVHPPEDAPERMHPEIDRHTIEECLPVLKIGDRVLKGDEDAVLFNLKFPRCLTGVRYENRLRLVNMGLPAVRYGWKRVPLPSYKLPLQLVTRRLPAFFFNVCDSVILPGQEIVLPFWLETYETGVYREDWELLTKPRVTEATVTVSLEAFVLMKDTEPPWSYVEEYMKGRMKRVMAEKRESPVEDAVGPELLEIPYRDRYDERDIFLNSNPYKFYDREVVRSLKELYRSHFDGDWNYSLEDFIFDVTESQFTVERKNEILNVVCGAARELTVNNFEALKVGDLRPIFVTNILGDAFNRIEEAIEQVRSMLDMPPIPIYSPPPILEQSSYSIPTEPYRSPFVRFPIPEAQQPEEPVKEVVGVKGKSKKDAKKKTGKPEEVKASEGAEKSKKQSKKSLRTSHEVPEVRRPRIKIPVNVEEPTLVVPSPVVHKDEPNFRRWYTREVHRRVYDILADAVDSIAECLDLFTKAGIETERPRPPSPPLPRYKAWSFRCPPFP